ncbi:MAG: tRNA epoxyqueuosine(34) reductase QueG [Shewanella sp.]|nr:tRNA epoxyqueuosine(34) reductase QueG [Shewanella sp.]MCF1431653.1 tRNA epoxyqueuosine(34) reductase QueG [Shewanella sp.]MCF1439456.1 tRNA epoxyqueuosine(34) reductase QueG [Shewanella sp.]MCF1457935.1 tRNA epoxyqueuosine(34) reductase QueG [Shewanella sp.]
MSMPNPVDAHHLNQLSQLIKQWGQELGFAHTGICDTDLTEQEPKLQAWLDAGFQGEMGFMTSHGMMRARAHELHPGTQRVIVGRMDYLPPDAGFAINLRDPNLGYISRYAGGRDYHKLIRNRMKQLGQRIDAWLTEQGFCAANHRPFVDSAPLLERPLADKAGLGWTGKHSLLLSKEAGSWFFLGELLINLPLPIDIPVTEQCGHCVACIKTCPTGAIVEPYVVDSRRCISYLTIELDGAIPEDLRPLLGNRIYGCDDCQLACPVNADAPLTGETDFHIRSPLKQPQLLTLFGWSEAEFLKHTEGTAIRRIGWQRWQRNIAVALGNAPYCEAIVAALETSLQCPQLGDIAKQHVTWALAQQHLRANSAVDINRKQQRLIRAVEKGLPRDA